MEHPSSLVDSDSMPESGKEDSPMLFLVITDHPAEGKQESLLPVSLKDLKVFLDVAINRGRSILAVARLNADERKRVC